MNYKDLTQDELDIAHHRIAMKISYYNAGEGACWYTEASARSLCQQEYKEVCAEYTERGIVKPVGDYLI